MIFFETRNTIERLAGITIFLLFVWLVALFETIVVEFFLADGLRCGNYWTTEIRLLKADNF